MELVVTLNQFETSCVRWFLYWETIININLYDVILALLFNFLPCLVQESSPYTHSSAIRALVLCNTTLFGSWLGYLPTAIWPFPLRDHWRVQCFGSWLLSNIHWLHAQALQLVSCWYQLLVINSLYNVISRLEISVNIGFYHNSRCKDIFVCRKRTKIFYVNIILQWKIFQRWLAPCYTPALPQLLLSYILVYMVASNTTSHFLFTSYLFGTWWDLLN